MHEIYLRSDLFQANGARVFNMAVKRRAGLIAFRHANVTISTEPEVYLCVYGARFV